VDSGLYSAVSRLWAVDATGQFGHCGGHENGSSYQLLHYWFDYYPLAYRWLEPFRSSLQYLETISGQRPMCGCCSGVSVILHSGPRQGNDAFEIEDFFCTNCRYRLGMGQ